MIIPGLNTAQQLLNDAGFACGTPDNDFGAKTCAAMMGYVAGKQPNGRMRDIAAQLAHDFPFRGIDSRLEIIHCLAQADHETGHFVYMQEIWGPTPAQERYEGRADLGNSVKGDGYRFRGRGIFQLTGRANYRTYGQLIGVDLVADPDAAAGPSVSATLAGWYWQRRGCSAPALADDVEGVTRIINGGRNGLEDRRAAVNRLKTIWRA